MNNWNKSFPSIILVATASPCNAKCVHCPCTLKPTIRKTKSAYIGLAEFHALAGEAKKHKCAIRLSGYGEPLLHPDFFRLLGIARKHKVPVSLITNGSLMCPQTINRIMEYNLDSIEFSIDSHKEEIYNKIRIGLDFKTVASNVLYAMSIRKIAKSKTRIMVSIIDQPSINPEVYQSVRFWTPLVDKVLRRKYAMWGILPADDHIEGHNRKACPYPFERLMIDPGGYVRLCPFDDQRLIRPFGKLGRDSIADIWNGDRMQKIRAGHISKNFESIELCSGCTDWFCRSWTHNYRTALKEAEGK